LSVCVCVCVWIHGVSKRFSEWYEKTKKRRYEQINCIEL
jgi:hypothetical protein